jgi:hypothetical protein
MKKVIRLNESDLVRIVKKVIEEQSEEKNYYLGIQKFLNKKFPDLKLVEDGKTGPNSKTEQAIIRYQKTIGANPDGQWGQETWSKMPEKEKKFLKSVIAKEGGLIDQFVNWIGL